MEPWRMPAGVFSMTPDQRDCLRVICEWFDLYGRAPSYREIAREMHSSESATHKMATGLVERGWLSRIPHRADGLRILHRPPMPDFATPEFRLAAGG